MVNKEDSGRQGRPMTKEQKQALHVLYYDEKMYFGIQKLWKLARVKGIDVSRRQVADFLRSQEVYQTNAYPAKKPKVYKPTISTAPHKTLAIDLIDMQTKAFKGYQYILTGIDLFSKKGFAEPLKSKEKKAVIVALKKIVPKARPRNIRSDNGSEFINYQFKKYLKDEGISQTLSLPAKPWSNGGVERFNGTLKRLINMAMKGDNTKDWVTMLPQLVDNYNNSYQRVIEMTPNEADEAQGVEVTKIRDNIKDNTEVTSEPATFKVGDKVRALLKQKSKDGARWSKKVYEVSQVNKPSSELSNPTYHLNGIDGEGSTFYAHELQRVYDVENQLDDPEEMYDISKLIRPSIQDGVRGFIVRWKGYSPADDTFEPLDILEEDVPKMVKQFINKQNVKWTENGFSWDNTIMGHGHTLDFMDGLINALASLK